MIFPRRRPRDTKAAIADFWTWWSRARPHVEAGLREGSLGGVRRALTAHVAAIHPDIAWEFNDGPGGRHSFVLSPEGSPALRTLTERWLRAGPGPDDAWGFHAARQADLSAFDSQLTLGDRSFEPGKTRFGAEIDLERARVHILVHHPEFPYLDDPDRLRASFLLLDRALGEDEVERWLGEIRVTADEQPHDVHGVREVVAQLAGRFDGDEWALLEGVDDQYQPLRARVRVPFPRMDHPLFDLHGSVELEYSAGRDGLPPDEEAAELEHLTGRLLGRLGRSAVLVAVVSKVGVQTLHLYADNEGVVPDQVDAWSAQQLRVVRAEWTPDPGWELLRAFY